MNYRTTSRLVVSCVIWLEIVRAATAQPTNQHCRPAAGLQSFANGDSGLSGIVNFGLTLFGQNPGRVSHAAAADGMQLLARLMEQNGYDRQRAWTAFVQSSEGQRIMCVPGALSLVTEWFNAVMALPSGNGPAPVQHSSGAQQRSNTRQRNTQSTNQDASEVAGSLTSPFLGPYRSNVYGPGINSDATGRPFVWQPDQGTADPLAKVRPDVFGPGIGMDQYGRPVHAACPEFQPNC